MTQIPETIADPQTLSDGVLLRRFVQDADEHAFAIIVERHAGLVMSVCRRVVGQSADCDDAFQATFYALSQRPDSIRECRSLTGWLYSVAWRTSVRLVRLRKRSKMETLPDQVQSGHSDPYERIAEANDLAALDEELNQLPDKYRHVLVMNYFAQQSSQDIADQLNESKGTIDGRIREGKRMLRVRLARRGVEVGVLAIATSLTQSASASISPALISSTTQFAQLSSGFGSIAGVHGIDLAQMQVLSSAGVKVMGIQAGTFLATGLLMLTGALGISQLMARPDGTAQNASSVAEAIDTTPQDPAETKPLTGEINATGDAPPDSAAAIAIQDEQGSQPEPSGEQDRRGNLASLEGITGGGTGGMGGTDEPLDPTQNGGKAEFSTGTSRGIQQQLHQVIYSRPLPATLHFTGDVPLAEALDQLQTAINNESEQKVRFMLDTSDWAFADDVEFLNRTQISGLSVEQDTMTIASALDHIFSRVIDVQLTWVVKDEIILVTTEDVATSPRHALIRSYDVSEVKPIFEEMADASPSMTPDTNGGGMGFVGDISGGPVMMAPMGAMSGIGGSSMLGGAGFAPSMGPADGEQNAGSSVSPLSPTQAGISMFRTTWQQRLMREIQSLTPDCDWIDDGGEVGTMSVVGTRLIVRQSRHGHEKVVEVLEELEQAVQQ